jgi:hypothetical protein
MLHILQQLKQQEGRKIKVKIVKGVKTEDRKEEAYKVIGEFIRIQVDVSKVS